MADYYLGMNDRVQRPWFEFPSSHSLTEAVVIHSTKTLRENNSGGNYALMFYKRSGVCIKLFLTHCFTLFM